MKQKTQRTIERLALIFILAGLSLTLSASCAPLPSGGGKKGCPPVARLYLRADTVTKTMPDGQVVTMWGYALDSGFGALDGGSATSPGPVLDLRCANTLIIHLDNNLPVPTSLVINGQKSELIPVRNPDGRVRSFTQETPAGNTDPVNYVWNQLKPGTYLYMSGTHPALQVQMGLYGAVKKRAAANTAYPGQVYDNEITLLYSEIDPALHQAVATGDYGPGKETTSTIDYTPKYFLINGEPYTEGSAPLPPEFGGKQLLVRILNAGLKTRAPMAVGTYVSVIAEDGNPYPYPKRLYSLLLPAGKTTDVIVSVPASGSDLVFDRTLHVSAGP